MVGIRPRSGRLAPPVVEEIPAVKDTFRVAIDASAGAVARPSGVGAYVQGLVSGLCQVLPVESQLTVCCRLSRWRTRHHLHLPDLPQVRSKLIQEPLNPLFPGRIDLFHGLDVRLPAYHGPKLVATVHDLFGLLHDRFAPDGFRARRTAAYREAVARADRIITHSEYTRCLLIDRLSAPPERVHAIPLAADPRFGKATTASVDRAREKYGLAEKYLVYVGELSRRKNIRTLLGLFAEVARDRPHLGLALLGKPGYGYEEEMDILGTLPEEIRRRVVQPGYVPAEDLTAILSGAQVFCLLSLDEGFGIPVLEAFRAGVPVLASRRGSIPEVSGGAAQLVDPTDLHALRTNLEALLDDPGLRKEMTAAGLLRAGTFSWRRTAEHTLEVYRATLEA